MRDISKNESDLVLRISTLLDDRERDLLISDLKLCKQVDDCDPFHTFFHISGYDFPEPTEQRSYEAEGKMTDHDGEEILLVLYSDKNGRLYELEYIKWASDLTLNPDWSSLNVYNRAGPRSVG